MILRRTTKIVFLILLVAGLAPAQHWDEMGDGGYDAGTHENPQITAGPPLVTISGSIDPAGGDHVDCYSIRVLAVSGEAGFYATTDPAVDPDAVVGATDTRLWLWEGFGTTIISGNDDSPGQLGFLSVVADLSGPITYTASPTNPVTTGLGLGHEYAICYSYYPNNPVDGSGVPLVDLSSYEALNGPDPAAGPFAAYENPGTSGPMPYSIAFQAAGTTFIPVELMSFTVD